MSCHQSLRQRSGRCLIFQTLDISFQKKTFHLDPRGSSYFIMTELNRINIQVEMKEVTIFFYNMLHGFQQVYILNSQCNTSISKRYE